MPLFLGSYPARMVYISKFLYIIVAILRQESNRELKEKIELLKVVRTSECSVEFLLEN